MKDSILDQVAKEIQKARQAGYTEGWDAAIQAVISSAASKKAAMSAFVSMEDTENDTANHRLQEGSASSKVLEYIKNNPGQTGVEIVRGLVNIDASTNERTVRTVFSRLKGKLIRKNRKKWYPI